MIEALQECLNSFLLLHPELKSKSNDSMINYLQMEKQSYVTLAIEHALRYAIEESHLQNPKSEKHTNWVDKQAYYCKNCKEVFYSEEDCLKHELSTGHSQGFKVEKFQTDPI